MIAILQPIQSIPTIIPRAHAAGPICDPTNPATLDNTATQCPVIVSICDQAGTTCPFSVTDSSFSPGKVITVSVQLADPSNVNDTINGFAIQITYDYSILHAQSISDSGNVLTMSGTPLINVYCLDQTSPRGNTADCGADDAHGVASFGEVLLGTLTTPPTTGLLLTLNLVVVGSGFTGIHIKTLTFSPNHTDINTGAPFQIPYTTTDGSYSDKTCGGVPCIAPIANFTYAQPKAGQYALFNASASITKNPGAKIVEYLWLWNDKTQNFYTDYCAYPADPHSSCEIPTATGTQASHQGCQFGLPGVTSKDQCYINGSFVSTPLNHTAYHIFPRAQSYLVTLRVEDSYNVTGSITVSVNVLSADIDVGIDSIDISPTSGLGLQSGTSVTITTVVQNYGGRAVNGTAQIILIGPTNTTLGQTSFCPVNCDNPPLLPYHYITFQVKWDTSGRPPNVYLVDAITPPLQFWDAVRNTYNGTIVKDSNPKNDVLHAFIQIILPPIGGLSLLTSAGLTVAAIGVIGYGISRLRRRSMSDDSL